MSSATPPSIPAFSREVVSAPIPVGGWLLYFCFSLTILGPITIVGWMQKTSSPILLAVYGSLALTSFLAGLTLWTRMSSGFLWLRIALIARLLYAFIQVYLGTRVVRGSTDSDLVQNEIVSATMNIFLIALLFFYFRFSQRVRDTFGGNI